MQRVKSDDINADDEECPKDEKKEEKITSPIGAGLPLLQRLRLLKEKQVRFDAFVYCFFKFQFLIPSLFSVYENILFLPLLINFHFIVCLAPLTL